MLAFNFHPKFYVLLFLVSTILACNSKPENTKGAVSDTVSDQSQEEVGNSDEQVIDHVEEPVVEFMVTADEVTEPESVLDIQEPKVYHSVPSPSPIIDDEKKDFKVVLSVDSVMYLGQSGLMQVWIGSEDAKVDFSDGMTQDATTVSSTIGKFAKITPFAPDFEIEAMNINVCHKIDPNGSEVRFGLVPKDEGNYRVSANIELYNTEDCTGISVPKAAKVLSVAVGVDMKKEISKKVHELESEAWDKFKIFWIALMTLIFGAAIFVIRRFIKNKTGYDEGPTAS